MISCCQQGIHDSMNPWGRIGPMSAIAGCRKIAFRG